MNREVIELGVFKGKGKPCGINITGNDRIGGIQRNVRCSE